MLAFLKEIIGYIENKVDYGDARVVDIEDEFISMKNGVPEEVERRHSLGFGIRVLKNGRWGFSASYKMEKDEIKNVADFAIKLAEMSGKIEGESVKLSQEEVSRGKYFSKIEKDPFDIPVEEKINLLIACDRNMAGVKGVSIRIGSLSAHREHKFFASTDGAEIEQNIVFTGGGISAFSIKNGDFQKRSYPTSFGGNYRQQGWEFIESLNLAEEAEKIAEEAVMLHSAKECPSMETNLIIDSDQLALQIHESIGHALELDRVFGMEESYAGSSFATIDKLDNFRYGSNIMNITADSTLPYGLGTFGYDDEGVKSMKVFLIKDGILRNYLSSRETAWKIKKKSTAAMRASSWSRIPLVRMVNVSLLPGNWNFDDLIADTDDGILLKTNRSWSIDDKRLNFQFGTEIGYRIKNGKIIEPLKNCLYSGITPNFWNSLDAIVNKEHFELWGIPNCGKGEPGQTMYVGHGTSPARFKKVRVGTRRRI